MSPPAVFRLSAAQFHGRRSNGIGRISQGHVVAAQDGLGDFHPDFMVPHTGQLHLGDMRALEKFVPDLVGRGPQGLLPGIAVKGDGQDPVLVAGDGDLGIIGLVGEGAVCDPPRF